VDKRKLYITLGIVYFSYLMMIIVITVDAYRRGGNLPLVLLLQLTPLLMLAPGIISRHHRIYNWLCFLMLVYFASYVVQVYSPNRDLFDWSGLVLSIALFVSAMLSSRWLQHPPKI
jgi:uncharacterized membrane protein